MLSEYDIIKGLQSKSDEEIKKLGFNEKQIEEIRKFSIEKGDKEGYGQVSYTIGYYKKSFKYVKKEKRTYLKTKMTWKWAREPRILLTDYPTMTTSTSFTKDTKGCSARIKYRKYGANRYKKVKAKIKTAKARRIVYLKVNMDRKLKGIGMCWAKSGYIITRWVKDGNTRTVGIASNYGHKILIGSVSITLKGFGISFSPNVISGDEASKQVKR